MTLLPSYLDKQAYPYRLSKIRNADPVRGYTHSNVTLTDFKRSIYRRYMTSPHLEMLDALLMQVSEYVESGGKRGIGRAIVEMPPRHGKTLTVSKLYPIWHLGRNPEHRIMLVSYGASLAEKNSRFARNVIPTKAYQQTYPLMLARDSKSVQEWDLEGFEGGVSAMGIGGASTGKGAHLLILDDVFKNREEAESETIRSKIWDAYGDDLYTRLEPGGAIVVMMTRWHQDDLIGRLLRNEPDEWHRLRLPALAEENDPLGRSVGEALWPERYDKITLLDTQKKRGPYTFSSMYQQNPVPAEGGIFKRNWFNRVEVQPQIAYAVRFWDLAMSEKTSADYSVGVKIGQGTDGHYYLLDVARRQVEWGDLVEWITGVIVTDGSTVMQGIEEKGYMSRAIQELNAEPRLHGYAIWGYPVDKDKLTRALPYAAKCAAGLVHVLNSYWTDAYLDELCTFPNASHDDQVDASSGAWSMLDGGAVLGGVMNYG